jgi:VWFA-related protein
VPVQQAPPQKAAELKVSVELVNTPVTARDAHGELVADLSERDFRVFDNGVQQRITHFDVGGDPLTMVVVVENSSRIEDLLPVVRKTGILFTQTVMGPTGEAAVLSVNDSIDKLVDFTNDADKIERTFAGLKEGTSGLRLYDAMAAAVEMLQGQPVSATGEGRRRVVVVMSEALDTGSESKLGIVLRRAQLTNVAIYAVGLSTTRAELGAEPRNTTPEISPPGTFPQPPVPGTVQTPTTEQQRYGGADLLAAAMWLVTHATASVKANSLQVAAVATGGTSYNTYKNPSIEQAIDKIGGELHSQYSLSYRPTGVSPDGYHEIKVQVLRRGIKLRARPGYYLPPPQS